MSQNRLGSFREPPPPAPAPEPQEVLLSEYHFAVHFGDDATPKSAGGPGSLHYSGKGARGEPIEGFIRAGDDPVYAFFKGKIEESLAKLEKVDDEEGG